MGDFHQNGIISTLHNLNDRPLLELERELMEFSHLNPMTLILPSLFSELEGDALKDIISELASAPYLSEIVIGLDRADKQQFEYAKKFFSTLPQHHRILWNDGPRLQTIHKELEDKGLAPTEPGKGRNVWYCMGYTLGTGLSEIVGLHDCDILTYDRYIPARLFYPVANPNFSYTFSKGYYPRIADNKMNGRVTRLLLQPLLNALRQIYGLNEYLDFLRSFRYPLSGEFAMHINTIPNLRIPSDWGLEIGMLSEIYRNYSPRAICQVDLADNYDHKHQDVSHDDQAKGLSKMSIDITKSIFRKMATDGEVFSMEKFRTIKATYFRMALDMVEMYHDDAVMNGLSIDLHKEEKTVELFAANIMDAGDAFLNNPHKAPFIPRWGRISHAIPNILERLTEAVELDNIDD